MSRHDTWVGAVQVARHRPKHQGDWLMTLLMEHDTYVLGRSAAETRRLILQGDFQAPYTRRFLLDAGIEVGMRVLDVGSGAGDVALLAADLVGPQGSVVGIDVNPRVLDTAR